MQCPHCKSEWKEGNTKSQQQLKNCPFCGESLVVKKEEAPDTSTLGGVLRSLVLEQGTDIYKAENGHKLKAFLSDIAVAFPKERKTLNIAIQENIPSKLLGYDKKAEDERQIAMYDCVYQLEEDCGLSKERATEVVNYLAVGLGWSVKLQQKPTSQEPQQQPTQPAASSAPVQQPSQPTPIPPQVNTPQNMVCVEGGTFLMGSERYDNEKPVHEVKVSSFYMGKYEVAQEEYQDVMGSNPSDFRGNNRPVENVSWYKAVEYCNRLSKKEGLTPCYSGSGDNITCNWNANGYRLPTEAEWEYAARGGINKDDYIYSGSNDINEVAWYIKNSWRKTHNVGTKKANSLGIYDMSGNVDEWCWDWYDEAYYSKSPRNNPTGTSAGADRVVHGGYWYDVSVRCAVFYRSHGNQGLRQDNIGFRVVRASSTD